MTKNITNNNILKKHITFKLQDIIEKFKDDDDALIILTNIISELSNIDDIWLSTINNILLLNIKQKFIKKIKIFFKTINIKNYLLVLNILLESYDTIKLFPSNIIEPSFYIILKELKFIINNNLSQQQNYLKSIKFLKEFKNIILS